MVSSARNPNESYAQRAKKASTSSASRTTQKNQQQQSTHAPPSTHPSGPSSLNSKPPQVNVWAERIKEQQVHVPIQPAQMPRQRTASSPQPPCDDAIPPRSQSPDLTVQLAILDHQDEHDPFVVRVPPHLSRQSSSSTNPLLVTDPSAWPLPGTDPHSNASSTGYASPFLSAASSRQNSTASVRHHTYSSSGSVRLSRVQSSFSHYSHSASHSRAHSRSGSSASSPRLQIRGRTLPQDDSLPPDLRLDPQHSRLANKRSSPALPDPPNHISAPFQIDPAPLPADPSFYQRPPLPPMQDVPPRYTHNFLPQFALPPHFPPAHVPGHASPPYIPHSGQATPPYPHYPPYPAYMFGHPPYFWGDIPPHSHNHLQTQPSVLSNHANTSNHAHTSNHLNISQHAVPHKLEFESISPTEFGASKHPAQLQNGSQQKPSKIVVFGTINPAESQDYSIIPPPIDEQRTGTAVEETTEQFAAFSIGVSPDEPGPSRLASRKSSIKSFSRMLSSQSSSDDGAKDMTSKPVREVNGVKQPIKWEFGTTHSNVLEVSRPPSSISSPASDPAPNHQSESETGVENVDGQSNLPDIPPSHNTSQTDRSTDMHVTRPPKSDDWAVKNYGFGFGDHGVSGNAPDVVRWEMHEREKERVRENHREREMFRDQYRDRGWVSQRPPGWRPENGVEEGREGWEQLSHIDAPRHMRPRRGSFSGYGGHERGGFPARRGRAFGGRFQGGRGRGFFHQRTGSYPFAPPPPVPPPPPPFEVLPPTIDMVNGYGPYPPPEPEPYEAFPIPPSLQPHAPFTPTNYSVGAMRNYLLGQLEYYLSPQNMAQDFYLRQRMDSEGWIPISLLASFKRVQQLHTDADIVREVLSRSSVVEVSGDWVRMCGRQWEVFVLPNAPKSVARVVDRGGGNNPISGPYREEPDNAYAEHGGIEGDGDCDGEDCEGDDEDDDIEFVIGEEAEGSWMPVPERKP